MAEDYLGTPTPQHLMEAAIELGFESKVWYASGDTIVFKDGESVTDEELASIRTRASELETAYNNKQYQRDRATEYKSIQEQLDMLYWDKVNGTNLWKEHIDSVKADNPKPTE